MIESTVSITKLAAKKIFGTDGVRGKANIEPVTAEIALNLGRAAAHVFKNANGRAFHETHKIVIGKDTRLSGYMLENALCSGILSMGVDAVLLGPLPTPGVAYITRSLRADAGIMITASHNPYYDNGFKFFGSSGYKLDDKIENRIEQLALGGDIDTVRPMADHVGKAVRIDDALGRYIEFAKGSTSRGFKLDGLRIVVDCANGASYKSTPCVLRELGAEVIVINNQPDGTNINKDAGSMFPQFICSEVHRVRADMGITHDGDADRVLLCDDDGHLIDGDDIMAIAALEMLRNDSLNHKTLVATEMTNTGLEVALATEGGRIVRTQVGDRHVIRKMLDGGFNFGGEQSGHIVFGDYSTTGDGLIAALQILQIMRNYNQPLSKLVKCWQRYPQEKVDIVVRQKIPFDELDGVCELIRQAEASVKPGRVLIRHSGTEPKTRVLVEGENETLTKHWSKCIAAAIRSQIGVVS